MDAARPGGRDDRVHRDPERERPGEDGGELAPWTYLRKEGDDDRDVEDPSRMVGRPQDL